MRVGLFRLHIFLEDGEQIGKETIEVKLDVRKILGFAQ
jgi:hypothetical protein